MYEGEQAVQVMAELKRRSEINTGRAGHGTSSPFTGLLHCGSCGYRMRYKRPSNNRWEGYSCVSPEPRYRYQDRYNCQSYPRSIKLSIVQDWFNARLKEMLDSEDARLLLPTADDTPRPRIEAIEAEIAAVQRRIEGLMLQRLDTPDTSQSILTGLIAQADAQKSALQATLETAKRASAETQQQQAAVTETLSDIQAMGLAAFWSQENPVINRMLFTLLGNNRIVILNGEIIGIAVP